MQNVFTKKPAAYLAAANDPAKRQELRQKTKKHGEVAGGICKGYIKEVLEKDEQMQSLDYMLELAVESLI